MDDYRRVEVTDELPKCSKSEHHYWMHDGLLWALPGEKEDPFPFFWRCIDCGLKIRTRVRLLKFTFEGNLVERDNR